MTNKNTNDIAVCDDLWRKAVKEGARNQCEVCGSHECLEAHHIFGRKAMSTRYDLNNGICLCPKCHKDDPKFSAHRTKQKFIDWLVSFRGQAWYQELKAKHFKTVKLDFEAVKLYLREALRTMKHKVTL